MPKEQTTICPKCGFRSQGPRVRPHNCAKRLAHPEQYQPLPRPAAQKADASRAVARDARQPSAPGNFEVGSQKSEVRSPLTLARLDAMPAPGEKRVALMEMSLPQLEATHDGLLRMEALHEKMSGACATLRGLVLAEIKGKLAHGRWLPWVKKHYDKSERSASGYIRLGKAFAAESKSATHCRFTALQQDVSATLEQLAEMRLDLTDPTVAAVIAWSGEKSATQLLLDLGPAPRGGDTSHAPRIEPTQEELVATLQDDCKALGRLLQTAVSTPAYRVLKNDAELEGLRDLAQGLADEIEGWLKLPKSKRPVIGDVKTFFPELQ